MNAIFKSDNKLVINGADSSEILLINNFIVNSETKSLKATPTLDINGDASGLVLELVDAPVAEESETVGE